MFRFLELSLHGWDLWQQVRVPLDRDVVLLVGPNGSGKTTFLDSIRQLLAARRLSSRRRLQHYLRQPDQPALIRAVVSNAAANGAQQPFHKERLFTPEVTLACGLVPSSGGAPEKRFAILPGRATAPEIQQVLLGGKKYYSPEQYERALANAGVTRSLMAVLAIEQGRTHELFESTPRELFLKVLDMLGDKVILDRYTDARRRYLEAKREVEHQTRALLAKQAELNQVRRQLETRALWEEQRDKVQELEERLPAARYQKLWAEQEELESKLQELRTKVRKGEVETLVWANAVGSAIDAVAVAERALEAAKARAENATKAWGTATVEASAAKARVDQVEGWQDEASRLQAGDLEGLERSQEVMIRRRTETELAIEQAQNQLTGQEHDVAQLQRGVFVYPEPVRRTMDQLTEAAIPCKLLCSAVDVVDDALAASVESALGDARFALLVAAEHEAHVIDVARSHWFPGPVYSGPTLARQEQAGPLRLRTGAPKWLANAIAESSFAADGSFRDRRGHWIERNDGRFLGTAGLRAALAQAEETLQTTKESISKSGHALDLAKREYTRLIEAINAERHRRELLVQVAELQDARERAGRLWKTLAELDEVRIKSDGERESAVRSVAEAKSRLTDAERDRGLFERQFEGEKKGLADAETKLGALVPELDVLRANLSAERRRLAEAHELDGPETVERDLGRARQRFEEMGEPPPPEIRLEADQLQLNVSELERHVADRGRELDAAAEELEVCRTRYTEVVSHTLHEYRSRAVELGRGADIVVEMELPTLRNDDAVLDEACVSPRFGFDGKEPLPMGDSSFSGGQQVIAGLILLMAMAETDGRGFFILDEPFAHLSIDRVDHVGRFLSASKAQFIITAPTTLDRGQLNPASMVIVVQKKRKDAPHAPSPLVVMS